MHKTIIMPVSEIIKNSRFSSCMNINCPFLYFTVETRECEIIGDAGIFVSEYCYVVNILRNATFIARMIIARAPHTLLHTFYHFYTRV